MENWIKSRLINLKTTWTLNHFPQKIIVQQIQQQPTLMCDQLNKNDINAMIFQIFNIYSFTFINIKINICKLMILRIAQFSESPKLMIIFTNKQLEKPDVEFQNQNTNYITENIPRSRTRFSNMYCEQVIPRVPRYNQLSIIDN
ncbi:Hypothetical_protein [Hexamita inflata]|uniref:Hypothetical_protein n=1 Tax=Hexamita inflata TaxID=28002 RepID=A0AA86R0B5_9EUKA|nr:Hypothetical protein HINF_LOCUS50963 [Hexamita inflata]